MPYTQLNTDEAADYLHLTADEVVRLARQGEIPATYIKNQPVFQKRELHSWLSQNLLEHKSESPAKLHNKARVLRENAPQNDQPFLSQYLDPATIDPHLPAKTGSRVLRELTALAARSNLLADDAEFLHLLEEREALCPTGLIGGVAIPHTRAHDEYLIMESFLVVARVPDGVPFGAADGKLTDLFIMPCAHDDRIHLYMVARIAMLLSQTGLADFLRACDEVEEVLETIRTVEAEFVESQSTK
jgi:PTS system nitrogen regulatory IIA component